MINLFNLQNKVALVTGAGRGLGKSMAIGLAEAGADVVLISTDKNNLSATEKAIKATGKKALPFSCDVTDPGQIKNMLAEVTNYFGPIDILLNNAGITRRYDAEKFPDEAWRQVIDTNLTAVFRLCRAVVHEMIERKSGKIINMASLLSFQGGLSVAAYAASKGAVVQLTKALANEWAGYNIQVNAIAPGYFATDMTRPLIQEDKRNTQITARIPAGRWGNAEDLKGTAVFLSSAASDYVNGHVLIVDGGWMSA